MINIFQRTSLIFITEVSSCKFFNEPVPDVRHALEYKPADGALADTGPAGVTDDVALGALVDRGAGQLETYRALQLCLDIETFERGDHAVIFAASVKRFRRFKRFLPSLFHLLLDITYILRKFLLTITHFLLGIVFTVLMLPCFCCYLISDFQISFLKHLNVFSDSFQVSS